MTFGNEARFTFKAITFPVIRLKPYEKWIDNLFGTKIQAQKLL